MENQDSRLENEPLAPRKESVALSVEATKTDLTATGIRSSPPAMPGNLHGDPSPEDKSAKSDSEAETIILPGKTGYSPSKTIPKTIKHEDQSEEGEIHEEDCEIRDGLAELKQRAIPSSSNVYSNPSKRNRLKQSKPKDDQSFTANSSGLSSIPTSPAVSSRPKTMKNDSDHSRSPSPQSIPRKANSADRTFSTGKAGEASSGDEGEIRKHHRQRSVGGNEVSAQRKQENHRAPKHHSNTAERKRKRAASSESPPSRTHRRALSAQTTVHPTNGLSHKKRRVPAPLLATRERQHSEYHSDESSAGGSPHPRSSRLRKLATAATGEPSLSATLPSGKMTKNRRDGIGRTALARACATEDFVTAKELLDASHEDLNLADNAGNTPLQIACLEGHADIVRLLIDHGCDIHCVNVDKDTPLLDAVENGHLEVVKLLLEAGVNPRRGNVKGEEPLDRIPEDIDDFEEIKETLTVARSNYTETRRPSEELSTHDNDDGSSRGTNSPRHSPPMQTQEDISALGRRRRANGRSTKTRNELLYQELNAKTLRGAAASGDTELVNRILQVRGQIADTESLVAACRGGHEDVIQLLLAIGGADADPPPLSSRSGILPESATPMLAAIGREKFEVVKLLLDQPNFDPTKRHQGETYFEIAKRRAGPRWREEEVLLRDAYNKPAGESRGATGRARSPELRRDSDRNGKRQSDRAEQKMSSAQTSHNDSEVKRRGNSGTMDGARRELKKRSPSADTNVKTSSGSKKFNQLSENTPQRPKLDKKKSESEVANPPLENDPVKPRRKLMSGKDLKGEKQRRESIASTAASQTAREGTESKLAESNKLETSRGKSTLGSTTNLAEPDLGMDKAFDKGRNTKRDGSKDRLGAIRGQSPSKRVTERSTPPPRATSHDSNHTAEDVPSRKSRIDSDGSSPENRLNSSLLSSESVRGKSSATHTKHRARQGSVASQGHNKNPDGISDAKKTLSQNRHLTICQNSSRPSEKASSTGATFKSQHDSSEGTDIARIATEREVKHKIEREERIRQEAEKAEEERRRKEIEKAEAEELARREAKAEQLKHQREEEEKQKLARERQREQEEKLQYEAKLKQEESERKERQAREDAEARHRAEEEKRRLYLEQEEKKREEEKRKKAARDAEARAEHARREEERRAKLPQLLQTFEIYPAPQTPEFASLFKQFLGFRYDTLVYDATGEEAKGLWIINTQVALLLGLKDLQLSRYTAWDRIPAPAQAKKVIYALEGDRYACTEPPLRYLHPEKFGNGQRALELRNAGFALFNNMDLFFVKLSDFMFVVPNFPHLRGMKMSVLYKECPKEDGSKWSKWKAEPNATFFKPRWTDYVDGEVVNAYKPTFARGSRTPIPRSTPKAPLDPENRLRRLDPSDPQYRDACRRQGLWHLLPEEERPETTSAVCRENARPFTTNGSAPAMNGFTTSPSVPSEPGKSQQQAVGGTPGSPIFNDGFSSNVPR